MAIVEIDDISLRKDSDWKSIKSCLFFQNNVWNRVKAGDGVYKDSNWYVLKGDYSVSYSSGGNGVAKANYNYDGLLTALIPSGSKVFANEVVKFEGVGNNGYTLDYMECTGGQLPSLYFKPNPPVFAINNNASASMYFYPTYSNQVSSEEKIQINIINQDTTSFNIAISASNYYGSSGITINIPASSTVTGNTLTIPQGYTYPINESRPIVLSFSFQNNVPYSINASYSDGPDFSTSTVKVKNNINYIMNGTYFHLPVYGNAKLSLVLVKQSGGGGDTGGTTDSIYCTDNMPIRLGDTAQFYAHFNVSYSNPTVFWFIQKPAASPILIGQINISSGNITYTNLLPSRFQIVSYNNTQCYLKIVNITADDAGTIFAGVGTNSPQLYSAGNLIQIIRN